MTAADDDLWVARKDGEIVAVESSARDLAAALTAAGVKGAVSQKVRSDKRRARFWHLGRFHGGWAPTRNGLGEASGWTFHVLRTSALSVQIGWHRR